MPFRRSLGTPRSDHQDIKCPDQLLDCEKRSAFFPLDRHSDWRQPNYSFNADFPNMNNDLIKITPACVHGTPCAFSMKVANHYPPVDIEVTPELNRDVISPTCSSKDRLTDQVHIETADHSGSFDQILPFIGDQAAIYVSQPVFVGTDITVNLTSTDIKVDARTDHPFDHNWVSTLCKEHEAALWSLATKTLSHFKADSVRLIGKLVQPHPDLAGYIDIYRVLVFTDRGCILDYPYQMQIFEDDDRRIPRFVISIAKDTVKAIQTITQDATAAFIRSDLLSEDDTVWYEGFCWMSVHQTMYRPSFFVPYEPGRFSEVDACAWMSKAVRQGFPDIAFVTHLDGIEWP